MQIILDIDGTLCSNNRAFFFQLCNTTFALGITAERLAGMTRTNFLTQPEVVALRSQLGADLFTYQLGWLDFHPQAILAALVIPGAIEGVARLAELGPISYYTARFSHDQQKHAAIVSSTHQWLANHHFSNPNNVSFCDGIQQKLHQLIQLGHDTDEQIVFIDDSYERLLANIALITDQREHRLLHSLFTLVAAHTSKPPTQTHGIQIFTLPHWNAVTSLIQHIQQKEASCL